MSALCKFSLLVAIASNLAGASASVFPDCTSFKEDAKSLSAYNASLVSTTHFSEGARNITGVVNEVPFCEAMVSVKYGRNSTLNFALWLPDTGYSSRFMAIGNGGQAGEIVYPDLMEELNSGNGFAVAGGDGGHRTSDNDAGTAGNAGAPGVYQPFLHNNDQMEAWIRDAISIFTPAAKAAIAEYYGEEIGYSYYRGCSAGGAQGFALAELYPDLFDGIIAGCPANWFTHLLAAFLWNQQHANTNATYIPQSTLDFMQASVIQKCDTLDGVADKLIENPLACTFNMSSLACTTDAPAADATCLTPAQLSTVEAFYQGPIRSDSPGTSIFPGLSLGSEAGWMLPQIQGALSNGFSIPLLQQLVFNNISYDPATFNWGSDVDLLDAKLGPFIDAIGTDLSAYRKSGGKMIVNAGWADPNIAPMWSLQHAEAITQDTIGKNVSIADNDFLKLVMIPGGGHCGANIARYPAVPAVYGFSTAMVKWVEGDTEPVAGIKSWKPTNGEDRTRRLCTWPHVAKLKDGGDMDDWESYVCG